MADPRRPRPRLDGPWHPLVRALVAAVLCGGGLGALHAEAAGELDLAARSGCLRCHAADHPVLGPSFRDIAARYRGIPQAPLALALRVRNGSVGVWGTDPMPPATQIADDELRALIAWILTRR